MLTLKRVWALRLFSWPAFSNPAMTGLISCSSIHRHLYWLCRAFVFARTNVVLVGLLITSLFRVLFGTNAQPHSGLSCAPNLKLLGFTRIPNKLFHRDKQKKLFWRSLMVNTYETDVTFWRTNRCFTCQLLPRVSFQTRSWQLVLTLPTTAMAAESNTYGW